MEQRRTLAKIPLVEAPMQALSESKMAELKQRNKEQYSEVKEVTQRRADQARTRFQAAGQLLTPELVESLTTKMAKKIARQLRGTAPLVLTLYSEGVHFSNKLTNKLAKEKVTLQENYLDFRFDGEKPTLLVEPTADFTGRTILLVDGALRDGKKMQAAIDYCARKKARAVFCAVLIDVPKARAPKHRQLKPSFSACECPSYPLIGFGFDTDGFFRNEPGVRIENQVNKTVSILHTFLAETRFVPPLLTQTQFPINLEATQAAAQAEQTLQKLELLYTGKEIKAQMRITAEAMREKLKNENPVVLAMQKGGSHVTSELTELLSGIPLEESYMHITRYGHSKTGGNARLLAAPAIDVKGRVVVISEDLIEGGLTMQYAISLCLQRGATEVLIVAMGDKPQKRLEGLEFIKPDFHCYVFDNRFLVGCGLDEQEYLRNEPAVYAHPQQSEPETKADTIESLPKTPSMGAPTPAPITTPAQTKSVSQPKAKWTLGKCLALGALAAGSLFAVKLLIERNRNSLDATTGIKMQPS